MEIFFGTDGWRALLESEMNFESVAKVAQAFADYMNSEGGTKVAISYDTRRYSPEFAELFAEVLSGNGIEVLLSDKVTPTPVLSFTTLEQGCDAGVMVTASHNPPQYNGIKFKCSKGGPFSLEQTRKVEAFLGANPIRKSAGHITVIDMLPAYIARIEQLIDFEAIRSSGISVLVDSMGGAGMRLTESLLKKHGCKVDTIFGESSNDFCGRLAEPIEKNLGPLMEALKQGDWSLGVATDGDADRLGLCMDGGRWLSAQKTILILVDYLKRVRKLPGDIVKTSSVTDLVRVDFESDRVKVFDVQVGFKYIADLMYERQIAFGGEESGGFGYGLHIPERDGIFSSLLAAEMLAVSGFQRLSEYVEERTAVLGDVHHDRIDFHYDGADRLSLLPRLCESIGGYAEATADTALATEASQTADAVLTLTPADATDVAQAMDAAQALNPDTSEEAQATLPSETADAKNILCGFQIKELKTFRSSRGIVNGVKMIFGGNCRWLLMRASETENMIRFYAEGQTDTEVSSLLSNGKTLLISLSDKKETD